MNWNELADKAIQGDAITKEEALAVLAADDDELLAVMHELRDFMFARVYTAGRNARAEAEAIAVIRRLVDHHLAHPEALPDSYRDEDADLLTQVVDYVSGMTDRYALALHERLFGTALLKDPALPA